MRSGFEFNMAEIELRGGNEIWNWNDLLSLFYEQQLAQADDFLHFATDLLNFDRLEPDFPPQTILKEINIPHKIKMSIEKNIYPYTAVYIDATIGDLIDAWKKCLKPENASDRTKALSQLQELFTTQQNPCPSLVCLSVRTAFDLFLSTVRFPVGSEIIMSAINIPSMAKLVEHHGIRVVPWDVDIRTLSPKAQDLELLISDRTVAILVSHIYGSIIDVQPFVDFAMKNHVYFIEDCAEAFNGFKYLGHPSSDLAFFSFGVIKHRTTFGGAVAKITNPELHRTMLEAYELYPVQTGVQYMRKLTKYMAIYCLLNVPSIVRPTMKACKLARIDYRAAVVRWLRGFPQTSMDHMRFRPSTALLSTMSKRLSTLDDDYFLETVDKVRYARAKLPPELVAVGADVATSNYWLFPILVDNPVKFTTILNDFGVDAYEGATQLNVILPSLEPVNEDLDVAISTLEMRPNDVVIHTANVELTTPLPKSARSTLVYPASEDLMGQVVDTRLLSKNPNSIGFNRFPSSAKYLIDHVVYLPIHKNVPYEVIDVICDVVRHTLTCHLFKPKL